MGRHYLADAEVRAEDHGDSLRLSGYAAVFDTVERGEMVARTAFNRTLDHGADVRLLLNHDGLPLARTKSGTLRLSTDDRGLKVDADLDAKSQLARDVMSAVSRGDMTGMSFGFRTIDDTYDEDGNRVLRELALHDVSVVTYPWYESTTVVARSAEDLDDVSAERLEQMLAEYRASKPSDSTDVQSDITGPAAETSPDEGTSQGTSDLRRRLASAYGVTPPSRKDD